MIQERRGPNVVRYGRGQGGLATPPTYFESVMNDGPTGYWRLGEPSGTTMEDSSGSNRDGTYVGGIALGTAGLIVDDNNTAATFNGTDSYGSLAANAWMEMATLTVEAIISSTQTGNKAIMDRDNSLSNRTFQYRMNAGKLEFVRVFNTAGSSSIVTSTSVTSINDGNPHHCVATYDGGTIRLYIDGTLDKTTTAAGGIFVTNVVDLRIGARLTTPLNVWNGILDEAAIYNRVLSVDRILAHAQARL